MSGIVGAIKTLYVKLLVWLGAEPPEGFEQLLPDTTLPKTYTLKQGDTLFSVARKFGVHYERIAQANGIKDLESVKPGQTLTIPGPDWTPEEEPAPEKPEETKPPTKPSKPISKEEPIEEVPVEEPPEEEESATDVELPEWLEDVEPEEVEETPEPEEPDEEQPAPEHIQEPLPDLETDEENDAIEEAPPEEEMVFRYEVQRGDTLNAIARRYSTTVKELTEANNLADTNIFPGQKLIIPGYRLPKTEPTPDAPPHRPLPDVGDQFVYTVVSGDTLSSIAKRYGITVRELIDANQLEDPNRIHIGQKLIIPGVLPVPERPKTPDEPEPRPIPIAPVDPDFPPIGPSTAIRALYTSYFAIGQTDFRQGLFNLLDTTELNAVVIDAKSDYGWLSYPTQVAWAKEVGANRPMVQDFQELMEQLKARGIYTVARMVTFKDNLLAKSYPELAIKTEAGSIWQDNNNMAWADPFLREVWDYNIQVSTEAVQFGFDEILFDFLRFPTVSQAGTPFLSQEITKETRMAAINGFLSVARGQLKPLGVKIAASTFGYTSWRSDDSLIGQNIERMAQYLDVMCPTLSPSTFSKGIPGYKVAIAHPYEVVYQSALQAVNRVQSSGCTVRPWIQDFQDYRFDQRSYGREEIQAQIKGCFDAGCEGFMAWNPQGDYTSEAYAPIIAPEPSI
ncbi:MAG: LysM peptidoglycan-binding domain-containing protein [Anaerolineae bacterium]|nr:LysM peptidoglycan-binding domain-containing protein [Anaerolineae bacterium]